MQGTGCGSYGPPVPPPLLLLRPGCAIFLRDILGEVPQPHLCYAHTIPLILIAVKNNKDHSFISVSKR